MAKFINLSIVSKTDDLLVKPSITTDIFFQQLSCEFDLMIDEIKVRGPSFEDFKLDGKIHRAKVNFLQKAENEADAFIKERLNYLLPSGFNKFPNMATEFDFYLEKDEIRLISKILEEKVVNSRNVFLNGGAPNYLIKTALICRIFSIALHEKNYNTECWRFMIQANNLLSIWYGAKTHDDTLRSRKLIKRPPANPTNKNNFCEIPFSVTKPIMNPIKRNQLLKDKVIEMLKVKSGKETWRSKTQAIRSIYHDLELYVDNQFKENERPKSNDLFKTILDWSRNDSVFGDELSRMIIRK